MSTGMSLCYSAMKQKLSHLSLGSSRRSVAISGLLLLLFYTFSFNYHTSQSLVASYLPFRLSWQLSSPSPGTDTPTNISHLVFGIVGTVNTWNRRRPYVESWWRPNVTRGYLFLDRAPSKELREWPPSSPPVRVNEDITRWGVLRRVRNRVPIRIFRTILEMFRQGDKDVRWYVMADDDTVLFVDNLVEVLSRYDHTKYYYIGSSSEFFMSNFLLSFEMAFGGAGYALSYPVVEMLATELDACIKRNPWLYSSDIMLHICLTDHGISLTQERGFHQVDFHGDISGFLSAHPQSPVLSLHHIDAIDPIFPSMNHSEAINQLMKPAQVDQSRLLQQTICYHRERKWSISVSWGYSAHIYENILSRSFLRRPMETFKPWMKRVKPPLYMFNTRILENNPCIVPHVFFLKSMENASCDEIVTTYTRASKSRLPSCALGGNHSANPISRVQVFSPRRRHIEAGRMECCDVLADNQNTTKVRLRPCMFGEVIA
ncbi:hypothetical protein EUGRSUZ_B03707 [Eucalyptus grandis]|uniref:Uncharacterized protein n=2 Tax=Eucalyptus grandis TaxID=71139 RepID=A0ACC3LY76_EUCGR|nr:hypothetical protein EUGRSUZ_B03707 [Eucalyptus grandis]